MYVKNQGVGRPKIVITKNELLKLYDEYADWNEVARALSVSRSTVFRTLKEVGMQKKLSYK